MSRLKKQYPEDFKTMFGVSTMGMIETLGTALITGTLMTMECMDYNKYKVGKSMEGTVNSLSKFTGKIQAAFASALTGVVLAAVGYDAAAYENATTVPRAFFNGLGIMFFALPAVFALLSVMVIYFYPLLRPAQRAAMYAEIEAKKAAIPAE